MNQSQIKRLIVLFLLALFSRSQQLFLNKIQRQRTSTISQGTNPCTITGSNNKTTIGFGNCYENIYYITMLVGTPSQSMSVQFDTGSNILWLPTVLGTGHGFNSAGSTTYSITSSSDSIFYADGSSVSGFYGSDVVKLANTNISVQPQILWVNSETGMDYPPPILGLVGMGYTTTPNFLDVAYKNNEISSPVFALALTNTSSQSILFYNQLPDKITNQTFYVPVVGNQYWQVNVIGVEVGGMDFTSISASVAVIDSGTSYFYLNSQLFTNVIINFFGQCNNNVNPPICPCGITNWPTFTFMFNGIQVKIEQSQYMGLTEFNQCTYNFGTISSVSELLLGDIFFRNYIVTFDKPNKRIGFAGNLDILDSALLEGGQMAGFILLGIAAIILIIGMIGFCCLGTFTGPKNRTYNKSLQLSNFNPSRSSPYEQRVQFL